MHWWQIAIRLLLAANCFGSFSAIIRARRERQYESLQWVIPKAIAWTGLFFALLPAKWGGIGLSHGEVVAWCSIASLLCGIIIEKTNSYQPPLTWTPIEIPHFGSIDLHFIPHLLIVFSLVVGLMAIGESVHLHRITADDKVFLAASSLGLLFGIRLCLRQYSLSRLTDLFKLVALKPRPPETPAQHDWLKPDDH